nr:hypothetical protein [uncultured Desulfobacter sp.]
MDRFLGFWADIVLTEYNNHEPASIQIDQGRPVAVIKKIIGN